MSTVRDRFENQLLADGQARQLYLNDAAYRMSVELIGRVLDVAEEALGTDAAENLAMAVHVRMANDLADTAVERLTALTQAVERFWKS